MHIQKRIFSKKLNIKVCGMKLTTACKTKQYVHSELLFYKNRVKEKKII